jgi:hypothetical protein
MACPWIRVGETVVRTFARVAGLEALSQTQSEDTQHDAT